MERQPHLPWAGLFLFLTGAVLCAASVRPSMTPVVISSAVLFLAGTKLSAIFEMVGTLHTPSYPEHVQAPTKYPQTDMSAVILAYLPNEEHIICSTVRHDH
jgi:hypothetical protein